MTDPFDLTVRPTEDQRVRFRALSASARYAWLASLLKTMHTLASPETKAEWRAMKQARSGGFLAVACAFASALDRADFDQAARCVKPECAYDSGRGAVAGVAPIIASYRDNHEWAMRTLEQVRYRSSVEGLAPGVARISFEDRIQHRGTLHVYRCEQDVSVGASRLIERIVHRELPGERAALDAFLERVGARRA